MKSRTRTREEPEINLIPFIDVLLVIHAGASAAHQSVITVREAARRCGLTDITFAAQTTGSSGVQ
jgi:biopolymer transport protein ExbD